MFWDFLLSLCSACFELEEEEELREVKERIKEIEEELHNIKNELDL